MALNEQLIAGAILLVLLIIAFALYKSRSYRSTMERPAADVKHYQDSRDAITLEQVDANEEEEEEASEDEEEEYDSSNSSNSTSPFGAFAGIGLLLLAIVGFFFFIYPTITNVQTNTGLTNSNIDTRDNFTTSSIMVDGLGTVGDAVVQWLDLIVLLVVVGFVVSIFVSLSNAFGADKQIPKVHKTKSKNIKHYEGMRDKITMAQLKQDKANKSARNAKREAKKVDRVRMMLK